MTENGLQNGSTKSQASKDENEGHPETIQVPAPSFGFTEKGTFYLEVDIRLGLIVILGTLARAMSYINGAINQQEAKMKELDKKNSLLKPKANGSSKWLNLFK